MDIESIRASVELIRANQLDPEVAHSMEDCLHGAFLDHVAQHGPEELAAMAREILKTTEIEFDRWTA
jgi:hypothetical protein